MDLNGPSDSSKEFPTSLRCWVLQASAVWACAWQNKYPCVGKENEGGFLSGYVLISFQTLTPSCGQPKAVCTVWIKTTPTTDRPEKILTIKEVGMIGYSLEGGMNQNTPHLKLAYRWPHPSQLYQLNGVRRLSPEWNLQPRVVLDIQVWLPERMEVRKASL